MICTDKADPLWQACSEWPCPRKGDVVVQGYFGNCEEFCQAHAAANVDPLCASL